MITTLASQSANGQTTIKLGQSPPLDTPAPISAQALRELLQESRSVLFRFRSMFPFDLFPDEIIIDENKINIISKSFFFSYHIHSVLISDITDVSVDIGLIFATLNIVDSSNYRFPINIGISRLNKQTALVARKILQGLIAANRKNIQLGAFSSQEAVKTIPLAGETQGLELHGA